jgi:hypothetical protein
VNAGREPPREPLDEAAAEDTAELRALYGRLEPPPLPEEADEADPETAHVVGWMRNAWRALEAPQVPLPLRHVPLRPVPLRALRARRARALRRRMVLVAAAAAVLALAGAALWLARTRPAPAVENVAAVPARGIEILAVRPEQLELRSGPVRLVLLAPPPSESFDLRPGS